MSDLHEIRVVAERSVDDHAIARTFVFTTPGGIRRSAALIKPAGEAKAPYPVILYIHWYEPHDITSHRSQFVQEAITMAHRGAVSLMVETLWSDRDFFLKRTQADDENNSIQQVVELRQAMDILLEEPDIDPQRFALVGHDFGGMYGILTGSLDPRPTHYVIMAATPRFPDWYLYAPPIEDEAREKFIETMVQYDPITHVPKLAPRPILFQFADDDFHVPVPRAEEFFAAAQEPKEIKWYQAGHGLNKEATTDRIAWLTEKLGLTVPVE